MPLVETENQIWALLDHRKSESGGKGFPFPQVPQGHILQPCEQVASSDRAVVSKDCPGTCLHFMGSGGQNHVGTIGDNKPHLLLPRVRSTDTVKQESEVVQTSRGIRQSGDFSGQI